MSSTPLPPPDRTLTSEELALVERLAGALEIPVGVWIRLALPGLEEDDGAEWLAVAATEPEGAGAEGRVVCPLGALRSASRVDRVVAERSDDGKRSCVAVRLGSRSAAFAVAEVDPSEEPWAVRLMEYALAYCRSTQVATELREENEAFAGQLSSDLEELSFLRSMVDRLSSSRGQGELTEMAVATLPVLNGTVRARCLAFLRLPNPEDPYTADPAVVEGDEPFDHTTLAALVRRFGPSASERPLVRNWDAQDLPEATPIPDADALPGVRSLVLAPLRSGDRMLGWLAAVNRAPMEANALESSWQLASDEFGSGEATLMATTASVLATHAANLDLLREKEKLMVSMVRSLVSAIESKDKYTRGHSERVALYTKRIAEQIGYSEKEIENIYLSALLHDVGKIGVRDAVLNKEGKLTPEEYAEISRHPDEGWAILGDLDQLRSVLPGVLHHHERWDGRGYPDGLAGESIPRDGRVMAVADAFDAMTSDRSYRKGMPVEKAQAIIREGAGTQWDPDCVEAFFACFEDIQRSKDDYQETDRSLRERTNQRDGSEDLVHDVAGLAE